MKYLFIPIFITLLCLVNVQAQEAQENKEMELKEHKVNMSSGQLIISEVNGVTIEGVSGSQIIIQSESRKPSEDERAKGLRQISALGLEDNTGMGLSVQKSGNEVKIHSVSKNNGKRYTIKVPSGVAVNYEHSTHMAKKLYIKNTSSEIEVSANYNSVVIENATGPLAINTVYGGIEADFDKISANDATLYSVYSFVDVSVPASAKASFQMGTSYGQMFTDLDLSFEGEEKEGEMRNLSSKKMLGKLNGGGTNFKLKATYGKIYLRKK